MKTLWAELCQSLVDKSLDEDVAIIATMYAITQLEALDNIDERQYIEKFIADVWPLGGIFLWKETPEGFNFWSQQSDRMDAFMLGG